MRGSASNGPARNGPAQKGPAHDGVVARVLAAKEGLVQALVRPHNLQHLRPNMYMHLHIYICIYICKCIHV